VDSPGGHYPLDGNSWERQERDGERVTGAYALGPEAGEWLQQATLAIRAWIPLTVLNDTIQPFPSFSEIIAVAVKALDRQIRGSRGPASDDARSDGNRSETVPDRQD
jgi:hypothetical protein